MKMTPSTKLNLCILPLRIIDDKSYQKCILPKAVFQSMQLRAGTWMKCKVKGSATGYSLCQIYPRDIDTKCCYMDNCVGTTNADMTENNYLYELEPIERQIKVVNEIEISLEMMERFFNSRLSQLGASSLAITAKQSLAGLHLAVGCAIRTIDNKRLGIAVIYIDACGEAKENETFLLDSQTKIYIKNFHIGTGAANVSNESPPFFKYGYELAWKDLEDLLAATKLSHGWQMKSIRPHLNVLLVGPPGCGKTTMLNAFVASNNFNCFHITTDSVLQQYPGDAEAALRKVFANALHLHTRLKAGDPTVIIIENLELLCPAAKSATTEAAHSNRICAQLMKLLDDYHNSSAGIFCIATTSDPFSINATARRPGRFQHEIVIDCPNEDARKMLFKSMFEYSQTKPFLHRMQLNEQLLNFVGKRTQGFVAGDLALLVQNIERQQLRLKRVGNVCNLVKTALNEVKPISAHAADVEVFKTSEGFEFIGGMDKLKRTLEVSVLAGLRQADIYRKLGLKLPKGLLLYGPPGCAKTTFAKCLAKEANMTFISTSGAEVYSPYVGCAEKFISKIFDTARKNAPCLIFFDEIDTLAGRRPIATSSSNDVHLRILSTLLTEMDGVVDSSQQHILVVAASNRPDMIDDALLRPGRLSKHIYVPPPDLNSRIGILQLHAKRMPFAKSVNLEQIAEATDFYTGADMCNLCNEAALIAFQRIEDSLADDCKIIESDFVAALKITKSSLSRTQMGVYLRFQKTRENT